jgi:hypothetical protein
LAGQNVNIGLLRGLGFNSDGGRQDDRNSYKRKEFRASSDYSF